MRILIAATLISFSVVAAAGNAQDWYTHLQNIGFWDRLAEIKSVSELGEAEQRQRVPVLIRLLKDPDQSVRITSAMEIAEIKNVSQKAVPSLIENFKYENGEEGMVYVEALAAFGDPVLPALQSELNHNNWLFRTRACDAIRKIKPNLYLDGECKQKAQ